MIIEGIITTTNLDGSANVAAMGPIVNSALSSFLLRPYETTQTFQNIVRTGHAVFHVTDDAELIAYAAIDQLPKELQMQAAAHVPGHVLKDACRSFELRVVSMDASQPRSEIVCDVIHWQVHRDFLGFCRAKHAVIEAAILATRLKFLDHQLIQDEFEKLSVIVEKTAGPAETRAFSVLDQFVRPQLRVGQEIVSERSSSL